METPHENVDAQSKQLGHRRVESLKTLRPIDPLRKIDTSQLELLV
jgi:hypothetical protein